MQIQPAHRGALHGAKLWQIAVTPLAGVAIAAIVVVGAFVSPFLLAYAALRKR